MEQTNWINCLMNKGKKVYSQCQQDGIIEFIIDNIQIDNKFCVEFGWNSQTLTGGTGPNCANLIKHKRWDNLFLGPIDVPEIKAFKHFLTTENILDIFKQYDVPLSPGYISVDVDSTDVWLLDKLLEVYTPSFYSVEFNTNIPSEYAITFPNDPNESWQGDRVYGASLKCFEIVASKYNYTLVGIEPEYMYDAFYVRTDLLKGNKGIDYKQYGSVRPMHVRSSNGRHLMCLDYEHYLKTNNVKESQQFAEPVTTKYLI
jgi:hypothetical protein